MKHTQTGNGIEQRLLEKIHENNFLFIDELKKVMSEITDKQSAIQNKIISLIGSEPIKGKSIPEIVASPEPIASEIVIGEIEEKTSIREFDKHDIQQACDNLFESQNTTIDLLNRL